MSKKAVMVFTFGLILLVAASLLTGCPKKATTGAGTGKPVIGGTLNAYLAEPISLDPAHNQENQGIWVGKHITVGLYTYDSKTLELKPALATGLPEVNEDATVFTFKLRKDAKFDDGAPVTANDFKYSWDRVAAKDTQSEVGYILAPIKGFDEAQAGKAKGLSGVVVKDPQTLEVTLSYAFADFPNTLGHTVAAPVKEAAVKKWGDKYGENVVGTGPYKLVKWVHDQSIKITRNPNYFGAKPYLDNVNFKIYADENTALTDFKAGNLDYTQIPLGQVKALLNNAKYKDNVVSHAMAGVYYYGFDMRKAPWTGDKGKLLRQALNYAVDRQAIVDTLYESQREPATGIVPPIIPGFVADAMPYTYDAEKAKSLLKEAGYPDGKGLPKLNLWYNTGVGHDKIAQAVGAQTEKVGIKFSIEGMEWDTLNKKIQAGQAHFYRMGWVADYPSQDNFLYPLFYSKEAGNNNYTWYNNKEVDKMLLAARETKDVAEMRAKYAEIEKKVLEDPPMVPLFFYNDQFVTQPNVKNFDFDGMDNLHLDVVWKEKAEK